MICNLERGLIQCRLVKTGSGQMCGIIKFLMKNEIFSKTLTPHTQNVVMCDVDDDDDDGETNAANTTTTTTRYYRKEDIFRLNRLSRRRRFRSR